MEPPRLPQVGVIGRVARALPTIVVLLAVALAPSPTLAQHCGSYVTRPGDDALDGAFGLSSPLDLDTDPSAPMAPWSDRSCDGPTCSKAPTPIAPPAPSDWPTVEQWALSGPHFPLPDLGRAPRPSSEARLSAVHEIGGVFHPPRLS